MKLVELYQSEQQINSLYLLINKNMFEAIKRLFTKTIQPTSKVLQKEEQKNSFEPKIKAIKRQVSYRTSSKYR
jgi:tRNA U38,U39,U40 pseudouridine synthase TruA